jgi:hydrogenase maturation protease
MNDKIVIMGVGNWLMTDDGVGVHAAQLLAKDPPPGTEVIDAGTDALSALPYFEQADRMLIIDAVCSGSSPGTIRQLGEHDLAAHRGLPSIHAVNLLFCRRLMSPGSLWPEIRILGVEPDILDYGMDLSPLVADALPRVTQLSREIVETWRKQTLLRLTPRAHHEQ